MTKFIQTTLIASLLVSSAYANDKMVSYYIGGGASKNTTLNDTSINGGFNVKLFKVANIKAEMDLGLSLSNNDNNFLDLLPELAYDTQYGSFSVLGGLTVGTINNQNVVGLSIGTKYTTPFKNHNMQLSYKKSSLETASTTLDDINRYSVNYLYKY